MDNNTLKSKEKKYIAQTYKRADLVIVSGKGSVCQDNSGESLIDFSSGIGVNSLGFANEKWTDAVKKQIDSLNHTSNLYYTLPQIELAEKLCNKTNMQRVFFCNSGAEACEGAIKTARKYSSDKYGEDRYEIITLINSFHGRTIATLSATGQAVFHKHFGPFVDGFKYAEVNNISHLESLICDKTCAIMIELVQGEGGVSVLEQSFVDFIKKVCAEKDILLIVDEVQTGVGRTGKFLASMKYDVLPDIVTLAKGLGGGLPIGAVLFGEKTADVLSFGDHGTTFGGNPIVCAGACTVLDCMTDDFLMETENKGRYITEKLEQMSGIKKISGLGMMLGAELLDGFDNGEIVAKCIEKGLVLLTAKHKLRFLPPLNISYDEIDKGLSILESVLQK